MRLWLPTSVKAAQVFNRSHLTDPKATFRTVVVQYFDFCRKLRRSWPGALDRGGGRLTLLTLLGPLNYPHYSFWPGKLLIPGPRGHNPNYSKLLGPRGVLPPGGVWAPGGTIQTTHTTRAHRGRCCYRSSLAPRGGCCYLLLGGSTPPGGRAAPGGRRRTHTLVLGGRVLGHRVGQHVALGAPYWHTG